MGGRRSHVVMVHLIGFARSIGSARNLIMKSLYLAKALINIRIN